jgi:hypothetical protein
MLVKLPLTTLWGRTRAAGAAPQATIGLRHWDITRQSTRQLAVSTIHIQTYADTRKGHIYRTKMKETPRENLAPYLPQQLCSLPRLKIEGER